MDAVKGRLHTIVGKLDRDEDGTLGAIEIVKVCGPKEALEIAGCGAISTEKFLEIISGHFINSEEWEEAGPKLMGMEKVLGIN